MKRKYGWIKQPYDARDREFYESKFFKVMELPPVVDLRANDGPILDQGQLGACTGYGITGVLNYVLRSISFLGSAIFVYYNERKIEGTIQEDSGANIRDGISSVVKQGICSQELCPNDDSKFTVEPSPQAYAGALKNVVTEYLALNSLADMKNSLAQGFQFPFGIPVYASFESAEVAANGEVPMPKDGEEYMGGHCVRGVGYDDPNKRMICANSWGPDWGDKGYFYLPYEYIEKYASDAWAICKDSAEVKI